MPRVRRFIDLSNRHLPMDTAYDLIHFDGVTAHEFAEGWLVYVPPDPRERAEEEYVPAEVLNLQYIARSLDCDYILFDRDADVDPALPYWDW